MFVSDMLKLFWGLQIGLFRQFDTCAKIKKAFLYRNSLRCRCVLGKIG